MSRLKLLILDACVVIQLHELGRWQQVVEQCDIHLSEIVARREVKFDDDRLVQHISNHITSQKSNVG